MFRSRRRAIQALALLPLAPGMVRGQGDVGTLSPTPACDDGDAPTPRQTQGPFYTPDSPRRRSLLEPEAERQVILLQGLVLSTGCRPVAGALVDLWHADDRGRYDNRGFRYRGHQFTDDDGVYTFATVVPGLYPGRTRHFHVKVQPPHGAVLTTQLYFPDEPANRSDGIFDDRLLLAIAPGVARFDFVVVTA